MIAAAPPITDLERAAQFEQMARMHPEAIWTVAMLQAVEIIRRLVLDAEMARMLT